MNKVKFFLDTEFIEQGRFAPLELLSIGIVCENGKSLYLENIEAKLHEANNWVKENVLPNLNSGKFVDNDLIKYTQVCTDLPFDTNGLLIKSIESLESYNFRCKYELFTIEEIKNQVWMFIQENAFNKGSKPEFWSYFADYDWVIFCQLFGTMVDLPKGFPYYCNDLKQLMKFVGIDASLDELTQQKSNHNALDDAKQNKLGYDILNARFKFHINRFIIEDEASLTNINKEMINL
jgi:hypothetical protein